MKKNQAIDSFPQSNGASPSPDLTVRQARIKKLKGIGLLFLAFLLIVITGLGVGLLANNNRKLTALEKELLTRTLEITENQGSQMYWESLLQRNKVYLGDIIKNCFLSTDYLLKEKDDHLFLQDISYVFQSDQSKIFQPDQAKEMLAQGSRVYAIYFWSNEQSSHFVPKNWQKQIHPIATKIHDLQVDANLTDNKGYSIGIKKLEGEMEAEGEEIRGDFYLNGQLSPAVIDLNLQSFSKKGPFSIYWDTSSIEAGTHQASILFRSSDGRARVISAGEVIIPSFLSLENQSVLPVEWPKEQQESWFIYNSKEQDLYVNFVGLNPKSDMNIAVSLYDRYGNLVGENYLPYSPFQVLRSPPQAKFPEKEALLFSAQENNKFYIKVNRILAKPTGDSSVELKFYCVTSKEVAQVEEEYAAVLSEIEVSPRDQRIDIWHQEEFDRLVQLKNQNQIITELPYREITFLPLNNCLQNIQFFAGKESEALAERKDEGFFPRYKKEYSRFGLVLDDSIQTLTSEMTTVDGYGSKVIWKLTYEDGSQTEGVFSAKPEQLHHKEQTGLSLQGGKNILELTVQDGLNNQNTYTFFILRGQDQENFRSTTLQQFPSTYHNGLWLLHQLRPNYKLIPLNTNLPWEEVVENQDYKSRSLISDQSHPQWVKPDSPVYDGSSWRAAKREVVKHFLDPRNFFLPDTVFQFEQLSFDENTHVKAGVEAMIKNSFLEEGEDDFAEILLGAGKDSDVSPYFLTSRIIQEMGRKGQSKLAYGTLENFEGIYNFYNIGSTPNPSVPDGALINGAKFAQWGGNYDTKVLSPEAQALGIPWTSPQLAIYGGAKWISQSYIQIQQNTLYLQKFDVIDNEDGLYKHQYAQNIAMAYSESLRYFTTYRSQEMLDSAFNFIIPIYQNMPEELSGLPE